ncbi:MAG: DNA polymerase III subunit alpha [Chloroflexi bacterium]|nr:DNA polymerase III subunit alpha [Chloroflexota bacterium]
MVTAPDGFTHLEVHSHYTLLGGTMSVGDLVKRATADNLQALALTDTNNLYGIVSFAHACAAASIKPIIGMAVDVAVPAGMMPPDTAVPGRLVLLANGIAGYRSLCQLSSHVQGQGPLEQLQPQGLDWETLRNHKQGLVCLTGGRQGWIERFLRAGRPQAAARFAARLAGLYEEQVYLSICPQSPGDAFVQETVDLSQRFGLRPAAVQPITCLRPAEVPRLRLLAAIKYNCRLDEVQATMLPALGDLNVPLSWPTPQQVGERYVAYPEALANVAGIANHLEPGLPDGRPIWPILPLPGGQTAQEALAAAARSGLSEKRMPGPQEPIRTRLERELEAIGRHGFSPLFLIVADIVRFAQHEGIPVNTRGSVANSLVAYCVGITQVDPVAHDLLFERFLNPARSTLPDIDLDFCSRRRDEVLDYVRRTYGEDQVALVGSMSTMQPRSALRETAKAYGLDEAQIKVLATKTPRHWHPDPRRRHQWQIDEVMDELHDVLAKKVMLAAFEITGQPHHMSVHPGGVILTPGALTDVLPVQMAPKGFLITQYDHRDLERVGLPKLDLLGIRALTVLADTEQLVRLFHDDQFQLAKIPLEDERTGTLLCRGDTVGVFQCESSGARRTLRQLKARSIRDLAVANAFFKPGPATGGMAATFVRRYRGEEAVRFLHPTLEPILGSTRGVLLFQEQILRIARDIAGLSWAQADGLRKGMSKFQAGEMAALESAFLAGCRRPPPQGPGFNVEQAQTLWEQVSAFAGYGFNQGHATAYGDVSYRSAYLKAHYPAEFLCARLADRGGFHHPAIYMAEAQRLGIAIRPPHVNISGRSFTLTTKQKELLNGDKQSALGVEAMLWMGLGQIRDLRRKTVKKIARERDKAPFSDLSDLLARVPMPEKEIQHLIRCGALDGLGENRAEMLADGSHLARAGSSRQLAFDFARPAGVMPETAEERFQWESHILGMPVTVHPLDLVSADKNNLSLRQLPRRKNQQVVILGTRLPGWTGGKGFYLGDGDTFIIIIPNQGLKLGDDERKPWRPLRLSGQWREDEWGGGWFQAETITLLA